MLVAGFIQWWYGEGWRGVYNGVFSRVRNTYLHFSFPILLRTLFQPWRRIMSPPGTSLDQKMRAVLDNLVSRAVGFSVRVVAMSAALVMIFLTIVVGGILVILWPALPALGILLALGGLAA